MTRLHELSARKVAIGLAWWLGASNVLVWLAYTLGWWPFKATLLLCILFLPGLALLRAICVSFKTFTVGIMYSFGLSVLMLMLCGLVANQLLPIFGVSRPLELWGALGTLDATTGALIALGFLVNRQAVRLKGRPLEGFSRLTWLFAGLSLLLPCLATFGAFRLNNDGGAVLAVCALGYAAVLIAAIFICRHRVSDGLLAWLVFIVALSILLMTSLRGWDIVGHDIAREFRVYSLTHLYGHWDVRLDRDPYNACLSITILPEMLTKLLNISGLVVFKLILQIVFAVCPVVIFTLLRQYVPKLGALVGSLLFICYPTFINDSAMLTRQGVAYLFFALALLVISNKALRKRNKLLFLLCALGAILSHYSTAYMFVALFVLGVLCKFCITWWRRRKGHPPTNKRHTVLKPLFAGLLLLMTFTWYTQITATSDGLVTTLHKSITSIPKFFSEDNKSSDTSTALLFAGGQSQAGLYSSYILNSQVGGSRDLANAPQYAPILTSDDLPLTALGKKALSFGLNPTLITTLRQNFAKFLQLLALAGVLYAAYRLVRKKADALGTDFICLSLAGIIILALMVTLPVLSISYGVLRAFQQTLIFLILPITLLLVRLSHYIRPWVTGVATFSIVALFLLFTGFFAQVLGGVSPSLSLNNQGLYFGLYYSPEADARAFAWIKQNIPKKNDVRAANFNRALMHDPNYPFTRQGILPSQIAPRSYVYLDQAQIQAQKLYAYYQSSPLIMTFPLNYYDDVRNEIYSTSSTRIYR
jgi:uncharacterized membrane protein